MISDTNYDYKDIEKLCKKYFGTVHKMGYWYDIVSFGRVNLMSDTLDFSGKRIQIKCSLPKKLEELINIIETSIKIERELK